jgi:uncharacterized protein YlzI (FlbEa/FlbD family)
MAMKYIEVKAIYNGHIETCFLNTHYIVGIEEIEGSTNISLFNNVVIQVDESIEDIICKIQDAEDRMI